MMADVVELRPRLPAPRQSLELVGRLNEWRDAFRVELRSNASPELWREGAEFSYLAAVRAVTAAAAERDRDPELFQALLGSAARYLLRAQISFVRIEELGA